MKNIRKKYWLLLIVLISQTACGQANTTQQKQLAKDTLAKPAQEKEYSEGYYYDAGKMYRKQGFYKEALEYYNKAIARNDLYLRAYLDKGIVLQKLDMYSQAIAMYKKLIKRELADHYVYLALGTAYHSMRNHQEALKYYNQALKIKPNHSEGYEHRGHNYQDMGKMDLACADWKKALKLGVLNAQENIDKYCK